MFTNPLTTVRRRPRPGLRAGAAAAATALAFSGLSAGEALAHQVPPGTEAGPAPAPGATAVLTTRTLPAAERPSGGPAESVIHVVSRGETLSLIAARYGYTGKDDWRHLYDANPTKLADPDLIEVGTHVRVPTAGENFVRRPLPVEVFTAPVAGPRRAARASRGGARAGVAQASHTGAAAPAAASTAGGEVWDRLAACESGGDWSTRTGNGYSGGLQFHPRTWEGHGGGRYAADASQATREQQIEVGKRVQASQGWKAWPACSRKLGLR